MHMKTSSTFWFTFVAIMSLLIVASGCKDQIVDSQSKMNPFTLLGGNAMAIGSLDTTTIDALVRLSSVKNYSDKIGTTVTTAAAEGVFTNSTTIVKPSTVAVNGYSLSCPSNYAIYNTHNNNAYTTSPTQTRWAVTGYESGNFYDTTTYPNALSITSHSAGDTVSKALGFTLGYSGSQSGTASVTVRFDPGFTRLWKDSASAVSGTGLYGKFDTDDGSISISSGNLTNFTTGRWITVEVMHFDYKVGTSSTGKKVGVLATHSAYMPLYLAP